MKITEIFEGAGRITQQNKTPDVGLNQIPIEAAKFGFDVDKDGRPKNTARGPKSNILFNLNLSESKDYNNFIDFCCKGLNLKNKPNISLTAEKFDDTFGKFNPNTNELVIRVADRHPADVMRTIAHELVHHKQQENGEELDGTDGSQHENQANSLAGVLMRKWAGKHPEIFENFADGKKKGKSRPGRVKRAGASCKGSVTSLRKKAKKYKGERGKMYQWCLNMKRGRKRKKK